MVRFVRSGTSWAQEAYLKASNAEERDRFGIAVGIGGDRGSASSSITPGSTWNSQAWHRDGMDPSNLTDAVSVVFN